MFTLRIILLNILVYLASIECNHTFLGNNVQKSLVYHDNAQFSSYIFTKRIEYLSFVMPKVPSNVNRTIQGILAIDLTKTEASANVTHGGLGFDFVNLRMKSERGKGINFDVYIYA